MREILIVAMLCIADVGIAQTMYKCQNSGKVEYSDRPCAGVEVKRIAPDGGPTPEDRARARMRVAAEQERFAAQERQAAAVPAASGESTPNVTRSGAQDPDDEKITTHSMSGWDRKTRGQVAAEESATREARKRARSGQPPPTDGAAFSTNGKAWESEKVLVHGRSGWDQKTRSEIVADTASQAYRTEKAHMESEKAASSTSRVGIVTSCDPGGCFDSSGKRYNGTGQTLIRTDGKVCQRAGSTVQCN